MASLFTPPFLDVGAGITPSDGALLYFNVVGSETDKNVYTTAAATTPHANPVVADSKGVFPQIFLSGDYDWVLTDKNGVQKNTGSVSELATPNSQDAWLAYSETPTQTSTTTFTVAGDQTATFQVGRRLKAVDSSDLYGTITSSAFSSVTTVTVLLDTGVLSGSLASVLVGISSTEREIGAATANFWDGTATGVNRTLTDKLNNRVNGEDKGADNTGATDSTASLTDDNFTQNSVVHLGNGLFKMNKWMEDVSLDGNGSSTNIEPFSEVTNDGFALSLGGHVLPHGNWDKHWVRDLSIDTGGSAAAGGCIRFDDEDVLDGSDLSSGSYVLENLSLRANNGICVKSEFGSIGNIFNHLAYHTSDYGHWAQNNQFSLQHTGANTWNQCHWQRIDLAAVYLNDTAAGRGGWTFNQNIMEQNYGFGIFAKSIAGTENASTVPLTLNQMWFEKNGTEATPPGPTTVTIDSVVYTPKDMYFENFNSIVLNGTYTKSMDVLGSDVACYDCRHDSSTGYYSVTKDARSTINLTNPSGSSGFGSVNEWSHTAPSSIPAYASNASPSLRMAHRALQASATTRTVNSIAFEKAAYTWVGSPTVSQITTDGLIHSACTEVTASASTTVYATEASSEIPGYYANRTNVTGITQANPAVVTDVGHGLATGTRINIVNVTGMIEVNTNTYVVTKLTADTYEINVDSTSFTPYVSGGTTGTSKYWVVLSIAVKVISGIDNIETFVMAGASNVATVRTGVVDEWVTTVCMVDMQAQPTLNSVLPRLTAGSGGACTVRIADYQCSAFKTKQEASDFIHSGIYEYTA
jgi:hypothetical protein